MRELRERYAISCRSSREISRTDIVNRLLLMAECSPLSLVALEKNVFSRLRVICASRYRTPRSRVIRSCVSFILSFFPDLSLSLSLCPSFSLFLSFFHSFSFSLAFSLSFPSFLRRELKIGRWEKEGEGESIVKVNRRRVKSPVVVARHPRNSDENAIFAPFA